MNTLLEISDRFSDSNGDASLQQTVELLENVRVADDGTFAIPTDSHEAFVSKLHQSLSRKKPVDDDGTEVSEDRITHDVYDFSYVMRSTSQSLDLSSENIHEFGGVKKIVETFAKQIGEPDSQKKVFCTGQFWCILEEVEIYADELQERLAEPEIPDMPRYVSYVPQAFAEHVASRTAGVVEAGNAQQLRYFGNKIELRPHKTHLKPFDDLEVRSAYEGQSYGPRSYQNHHHAYSQMPNASAPQSPSNRPRGFDLISFLQQEAKKNRQMMLMLENSAPGMISGIGSSGFVHGHAQQMDPQGSNGSLVHGGRLSGMHGSRGHNANDTRQMGMQRNHPLYGDSYSEPALDSWDPHDGQSGKYYTSAPLSSDQVLPDILGGRGKKGGKKRKPRARLADPFSVGGQGLPALVGSQFSPSQIMPVARSLSAEPRLHGQSLSTRSSSSSLHSKKTSSSSAPPEEA
eukprot:ANDGO_03992.mRNA.1 hypothetical protein